MNGLNYMLKRFIIEVHKFCQETAHLNKGKHRGKSKKTKIEIFLATETEECEMY